LLDLYERTDISVMDVLLDRIGLPWDKRVSSLIDEELDVRLRNVLQAALDRAAAHSLVRDRLAFLAHRHLTEYNNPRRWWNDGSFVACMTFLGETCDLPPGEVEYLRAYGSLYRCAFSWDLHRAFVMVCERPREIHCELAEPTTPLGLTRYRLHRADGPAVSWPDGWGLHAVHGIRVAAWIVDQPPTVHTIQRQRNAEIRRVMIERYGLARYLADSGAEVVDQVAEDHPLLGLRGARLLVTQLPGEREARVYLDMINASPEPDGSRRHYLMRVNPKAYDGDAGRLCQAAMASLWRYRDENGELQPAFPRWQDYQPCAES
jgi:hypothetical protein